MTEQRMLRSSGAVFDSTVIFTAIDATIEGLLARRCAART